MSEFTTPCLDCPYYGGQAVVGEQARLIVNINPEGEITYGGTLGCGGVAGRIGSEHMRAVNSSIIEKLEHCEGPEYVEETVVRRSLLGRLLKVSQTELVPKCVVSGDELLAAIEENGRII